jgi:peptidoglycan/LPS O-acetylase OafA/YrhL
MADLTDPRNPVPVPGIARPPVLKALTSIRFFAAVQVALYHLVRPFSLWGPFAPALSAGYVGVSFFFFLSGYILTYSHAAEYEAGLGSAVRFWVARFARIYPVYLLSMIFAAYVGARFFLQPIHIFAYVADLLMVQAWSTRMVNLFHVTAWSLSVEMFFYALFPFLFLRLRPSRWSGAMLALAAFWGLGLAFPLFCVRHFPEGVVDIYGRGHMWVFRAERVPVFALPEFLAGVSAGWIFLRFPPARNLAAYLAPAGAVAFVAALGFSAQIPGVVIHNGLFIPLYSMMVLGLSERNWSSRLLSAPVLVLLGEASYALYLFHLMFNDWLRQHFGVGTGLAQAAWKLAILIPVSVAIHLWVERPARRLIMRRWSARHASVSSAPAARADARPTV